MNNIEDMYISIKFRYINGEEYICEYPDHYTFNDIKWDNALFYTSDYIRIDKNGGLNSHINETINVLIEDWKVLSLDENAIDILENNIDKIEWKELSANKNAIHILEKNIDKINWSELSGNINAINMLEANWDKIDWVELSGNINAINMLEANMDKIDWTRLSGNINAIHILERRFVV
jgi:hypothetical protein